MAALQCDICGGKLIGKPGGIFECDSCGLEYSTEWAKAKIQEIRGTVKVEGTVEVKGSVKIDGPIKLDGPVKVEGNATAKSLVRRMEVCALNREYDKIPGLAEQVLNMEPESRDAYLWLFLAECQCSSLEALWNRSSWWLKRIPEKSKNWKNVVRWCSVPGKPTLQEQLEVAILRAQEREKVAEEQAKADRNKQAVLIKKRYTQIQPVQNLLYANSKYIVALKADGTVLVTHDGNCPWLDCVTQWTGVKKLYSHYDIGFIVGLRWDGTMLVAYEREVYKPRAEQIKGWRNVVDFCCSWGKCVGLTASGKLISNVPLYEDDPPRARRYHCFAGENWKNVKQLSIFSICFEQLFVEDKSVDIDVILGLTEDGHVIGPDTEGLPISIQKRIEELKLEQWEDVQEIKDSYIIKTDGSLWHICKSILKRAEKKYGRYLDVDIEDNGVCRFEDKVAVENVVKKESETALLMDGTVVQYKKLNPKSDGRIVTLTAQGWENMVAIAQHYTRGGYAPVGVREDGAVLIAWPIAPNPSISVEGWKLFDSLETFQEERENAGKKYLQKLEDEKKRLIHGDSDVHGDYIIKNEDLLRKASKYVGPKVDNAKKKRRDELIAEEMELYEERLQLGIFSGKRKKKITLRLAQIEEELKQLK